MLSQQFPRLHLSHDATAREHRPAAGVRIPDAEFAVSASIISGCCPKRRWPLLPRRRFLHRSVGHRWTARVITHAHGDHARAGQSRVSLCRRLRSAARAAPRARHARSRRCPTGSRSRSASVRVSFHPAGHILGSAQVRIEGAGRRLGRLRRLQARARSDLRAVRAGPLRHVHHRIDLRPADLSAGIRPPTIVAEILDVVGRQSRRAGTASVLFCYTLGKAQRMLAELAAHHRPPRARARDDARDDRRVSPSRRSHARRPSCWSSARAATSTAGELVLAPLSARGTPWMRRLGDFSDAFASGTMRVRGMRRQRNVDRGFVLSDHADWPALLQTIAEVGASRVLDDARPSGATRALPAVARHRKRRDPHGVGRRGRVMRRRRRETVCRAVRRTRPDDLHQREGGGDGGVLLAQAPPDDCGVGGVLPDRPAARSGCCRGRRLASGRWPRPALEPWLLEECWAAVGDGAETAALILDQLDVEPGEDLSLAAWLEERVLVAAADGARGATAQRPRLVAPPRSRRAAGPAEDPDRRAPSRRLADARGPRAGAAAHLPATTVAARLMGEWPTTGGVVRDARFAEITDTDLSRPYPFYLASPLDGEPRGARRSRRTGWSSGSGTASARSWCAAAGRCISGRAARN